MRVPVLSPEQYLESVMNLVEMSTISVFDLPIQAFRDHLRAGTGFAEDTLQDSMLEAVLRASLAAIEARIGKALFARNYRWTVSGWRSPEEQALPIAPVTAITGVLTLNRSGETTSHDSNQILLVEDLQRPMMRAALSALPSIPAGGTAEVTFTAGYGATWDDIPADLRQAVLCLAAYFYENRGDAALDDGNMPFQVTVLTERYRTVRILGGSAA